MFIDELTESNIFSVSILFVILLNTVILIIQTDEGFSVKAGRCLFSPDSFQNLCYSSWSAVFLCIVCFFSPLIEACLPDGSFFFVGYLFWFAMFTR